MTILRDIVASFSVHVDDSPLTAFDRRVEQGKKNLQRFASFAATAFTAAAYGAYRMVDAASHANEALNVLSRTFEGQSDAVLDWSYKTGEAMGRSAYDLQEAVGQFGAFLEPQFKGTTTDIAAMSEALTQLSVDLASFYNTSDKEATMRLFSGLSGETEAVRRLGIDLSDTALDAFNKNFGEGSAKGKRVAALTLQEKTLLRYRKILADTTGKQNDAVLTAGSWENQLKRTTARIHVLAVELGRNLIPMALKLLSGANKLIDVFEKFARHTDIVKNSLIGLAVFGAGYVAWATAAAVKTAGLIGTFAQLVGNIEAFIGLVLPIVEWAALFLVVEDFVSFLQGKNTVIGNFITEMWGLQDPLTAFKDVSEDVLDIWTNIYAKVATLGQVLADPLLAVTGHDESGRDLLSILESRGYVDRAQKRTQRVADREAKFRSLAEAANGEQGIRQAAQQFRRQDETPQDAVKRASEYRRAYLKENPDKITKQDIEAGWSPYPEGMIPKQEQLAAPPVRWTGQVAPKPEQTSVGPMVQPPAATVNFNFYGDPVANAIEANNRITQDGRLQSVLQTASRSTSGRAK